jgi:exodeoxyribonuclease-3
MKIVSWNVNGIRSSLKTGFLDWFKATDPDLLSLQEIRAEWHELDLMTQAELSAKHDVCWFPASSKKGYAGAATLSRKGLGFKHVKGMGSPEVDAEGRIVVSEHAGFTFVAGYFPNASAELVRLDFKRKFSKDLTNWEAHAQPRPRRRLDGMGRAVGGAALEPSAAARGG